MTDDGPTPGDAEKNAAFERLMYRRSLKQAVAFMNKALERPTLSDETNGKKRPVPGKKSQKGLEAKRPSESYKTPNTKKKTKRLIKEAGDYSLADVRPTRIKEGRRETALQEKKGRINKYSELRHKDTVQRRKDFRSARKSPKRN